jgi:Xaa-Pro aminopeptidase
MLLYEKKKVHEFGEAQSVISEWQATRDYATVQAAGPRALVAPSGGARGGWVGPTSLLTTFERQRLVKSTREIDAMARAGRTAALAFVDVLRSAQAGDREASLAAALDWHCRRRGAARLSFPPVVANGGRALTLHYIANDQLLRDGDLVVFDGGCEMDGYCSDITRTFPVGAEFSAAQRDVYERVLDVNEKCIDVNHTLSSLLLLLLLLILIICDISCVILQQIMIQCLLHCYKEQQRKC